MNTLAANAASVYRIQVKTRSDPRAPILLQDAHLLGFNQVRAIGLSDLYFIQGNLSETDLVSLVDQVLCDPVTQTGTWELVSSNSGDPVPNHLIDIALRPGVTDPVAEQIVRAAHQIGIQSVQDASTGTRYEISGDQLDNDYLNSLARRLLANPVIQRFTVGTIEPYFPVPANQSLLIEQFSVAKMSDEELFNLSQERRAALDLPEMQAIRNYCLKENRGLTDVEFEMIAQTWSEHCVHKTFKGIVEIEGEDGKQIIDGLMKTYIRAATEEINAPWVLSAFKDNAGIIAYGDQYELSFKAETHNHPSAIEPFGGANTGVGGVIRDVIGVSAKPIANTDVLCFGNLDQTLDEIPEGVLHPRRIYSGVISGVQDYGNKIGIPTVNGAILFDPGFTANPLVFCGCVGLAPRGSHPDRAQPGDHLIILGGRTGRDGLRGATFSSMTMDAQTGEVAGASVQIGAPIVEKGLIDVIEVARDQHLYSAITDCGAGGLSSAVGEIVSQYGAVVKLDQVRLKYPGLTPWEIWLSEAQERMVLAVPSKSIPRLEEICADYQVEITDIGVFTNSGRLVVQTGSKIVLDLDLAFLHEGLPRKQFKAILPSPERAMNVRDLPSIPDYAQILIQLLAHPNIASKESVVRIYDHEIMGATVGKPLTGAADDGPGDACVLQPTGVPGKLAFAIANGINPQYGKIDPYRMAYAVVDEAVRNLIAVGVDPQRIALLDNFCWGDPRQPQTMGTLVEAARGCYDAAVHYQAPYISGKDSLNNEYLGRDGLRHSIPPSLLISSIGLLEDGGQRVSMDLKAAGNLIYLIGEFRPAFGGSHLNLVLGNLSEKGSVPAPSNLAPQVYQRLHQAICWGWIQSAHDLSEGGLSVSAAEMCIGGRLGLDLFMNGSSAPLDLFGETNGCLLVEILPENAASFEAHFAGLPFSNLGKVTEEPELRFRRDNQIVLACPLVDLLAAWKTIP